MLAALIEASSQRFVGVRGSARASSEMRTVGSNSGPVPSRNPLAKGILTFVLSLADGVVFAFLVVVMTLVRYDFHLDRVNVPGMFVCSAIALLVFLICGPLAIYQGRYHRGSTDQFAAIAGTVALGVGLMWVAEFLFADRLLIPTSVPIAAGAMMVVVKSLENWVRRNLRQRTLSTSGSSRPTLVVGAGSQGTLALDMIAQDSRNEYAAVGVIDDDPNKRHLRYNGIRVLGPISDIANQVDRTGASVVIIAITDMPPEDLQEIASNLDSRPVEIKIMPKLAVADYSRPEQDSLDVADLRHRNFRDVSLEDLIGRQPITTNIEDISSEISGRVVLVTGAGGSIGSQLCKQVARFDPARLIMTDRDESGLHATQLGLEGSALLTSDDLVLGDLRDAAFIDDLIAATKPDIIFHAAALKHLTFLERFPEHRCAPMLEPASTCSTPRWPTTSDHSSTSPRTRRQEQLRCWGGRSSILNAPSPRWRRGPAGGTCPCVCNVLGSRGSVLETFVAQVAAGVPVTVTDPEVTRYFMTADEACELVLQAAAIGRPGETLVLDMGEPIKINDLANRVITLSGRPDAHIVYTGLRPGEKLSEALLAPGEQDNRPTHPLITQVPITPIDLDALRRLVEASRNTGVYSHRSSLNEELTRIVDLPVREAGGEIAASEKTVPDAGAAN